MVNLSSPPEGDVVESPLFLAAPGFGSSVAYYPLVKRLGGNRTVYGLNYEIESMHDVAGLARHHADSIQRVAPYGSLHLGGFSLGGQVSVAIATILQNYGRGVESALSERHLVVYRQAAFAWWEDRKAIDTMDTVATLHAHTSGSRRAWDRSWPAASCSYMAQHRVGRTPMMPGTGYLCLATQAGSDGELAVAGAQFMAMLVLDGVVPVVVRVTADEGVDSEVVQRSIQASVDHSDWVQHAVVAVAPVAASPRDLERSSHPGAVAFCWGTGMPLSPGFEHPSGFLRTRAVGLQGINVESRLKAQQGGVPEWPIQRLGLGQHAYLQTGQLETRQTRSHLYTTVWSPEVPSDEPGTSSANSLSGALLCEVEVDSTPQDSGRQTTSTDEELIVWLAGATSTSIVIYSGNSSGCKMLRALQAALMNSASEVWLLPERPYGTEWGLAKSARAELGSLVRCVGCEDGPSSMVPNALVRPDINRSARETELRVGINGVVEIHRLLSAPVSLRQLPHMSVLGAGGTGMVTGGTGALGLLSSGWMTWHGASSMVLLSRSGSLAPGGELKWTAISYSRQQVCVELCDISIESQVLHCMGARPSSVVHSAGVLADALLLNQTQAGLQRVWAPKAEAAWSLHQASGQQELDAFVLFSSVVALLGGAGQANYAAANACLDGLARLRQAEGLAGTSIQWGAWAGSGMAVGSGVVEQLEAQGLGAVTEEQGLCALELAMGSRIGVLGMVPVRWPVLLGRMKERDGGEVPPFLAGFDGRYRQETAPTNQRSNLQGSDSAFNPPGQQAVMMTQEAADSMVLQKVHEAAGVTVGLHDPLMDIGVDSLAATELRNSLQQELGGAVRLPSTVMFDYPSAGAIAAFVHNQLQPVVLAGTIADLVAPVLTQEGIQVLAMAATACYAPGGCIDTAEFSQLLASGNDCLDSIPLERFDADVLDGTVLGLSAKQAHFLAHPERFDNGYFRISPGEAAAMDPHQRLLLEVGYSALASGGESRASLMGSATAVMVGVMTDGEWATCQQRMMMDQPRPMSAFAANGSGPAPLAGRLSFVLGLKGPCFSVTTVCSSSLVALDAAAQNLQLGRCTAGLVAGVNMISDPVGFLAYGQALAPDGKCKTFDAAANGLGRGDACGSVLLRGMSLDRNNTVVLRSTGTNQDGRSASMAAPNGPSQVELLQSVNQRAGAAGAVRCCTETHGTGTALGDPIEVGALRAVFEHEIGLGEPLVLGALKTRLGHTEGAAGVMGVLKAGLTLYQAGSLPNLHLQRTNLKLDVSGFGVALPTASAAFSDKPASAKWCRVSGVSSFGMSGTNSHATLGTTRDRMQGFMVCHSKNVVLYEPYAFAWQGRSDPGGTDGPLPSNVTKLSGYYSETYSCSVCTSERSWPVASCSYAAQHRVGLTPVMPGTGYLCLVTQAESDVKLAVAGAQFMAMLVLDGTVPVVVRVLAAEIDIEVVQRSIEASVGHSEWTRHALVDVTVHGEASQPCPRASNIPAAGSTTCWWDLVPECPADEHQAIPLGGFFVRRTHESAEPGIKLGLMAEWVSQRLGSGRSSYLQLGQLEIRHTRSHLYTTAWSTAATPAKADAGTKIEEVSIVWPAQGSAIDWMTETRAEAVGTAEELCFELSRAASGPWVVIWTSGIELGRLLQVVQAAVAGSASGVWLVSCCRGAEWGLAKSVTAELGSILRCHLIDELKGRILGPEVASLVLNNTQELELVLDISRQLQTVRLTNAPEGTRQGPVRLALVGRGSLSSLLVLTQPAQLGAMLQICSVGLNFRDVLNVLGMYPGDPGPPGGDCAGAVVDCTSGQQQQDVLGLATGSLRSYAATDPRLLAVMPRQWSHTEASAMPTVWVTVWMCLEELAPLVSGCGVLVQAATGGVGLVAVQCAQQAGARVCATAGQAQKQRFIRGLGVNLLSTTWDAAVFVAELEKVAAGCGLAVVLNTMSQGESIPAAACHVGDGGRFVEIGKRGIWSRSQIMAQHVRYSVVAMVSQCGLDPGWQLSALEELCGRAEDATQPLPVHQFELCGEGMDGFRMLQKVGQIGKVVLNIGSSSSTSCSAGYAKPVSVTGGTGGLGLLFGRWLSQSLASSPVLLSRSGRLSQGAEQHWDQLSINGPPAGVALCNVAKNEESHQQVERGTQGMVHSAGVLADALLLNQTQAGLRRVWAPKAEAAWSLHHVSGQQELDAFVLFSSVAALLGGAGQANYAAANACLDGLARLRRAEGLVGTSIQWGAWAGSGMAMSSGVVDQLEAQGLGAVMEEQGLYALELGLLGSVGVMGMVPVRWPVLLRAKGDSVPSFLSEFAGQPVMCPSMENSAAIAAAETMFAATLAGLEVEQMHQAVEAMVLQKLQEATGISVALNESLIDSGVDSLSATELRNSLQRELGTATGLPSALVYEQPTAADIVAFVSPQLLALVPSPLTSSSKSTLVAGQNRLTAVASGQHSGEASASRPTLHLSERDSVQASVAGIACCMPGAIDSLETFWQCLCSQQLKITRCPPTRWGQICTQASAPETCLVGAFLPEDLQQLLHQQFGGFPQADVTQTDIHLQVLLDTCFQAFADAGWDSQDLKIKRTVGVFTGCTRTDFLVPISPWGLSRAVASNLKLSGPHQNFEASCSSSYLATHSARQALHERTCIAAVAGGIMLLIRADASLFAYTSGILSLSGQMQPLGKDADGCVLGEACAAIVLQSDVSMVHGSIEASVSNRNSPLLPPSFVDTSRIQQAAEEALASGSVLPAELCVMHPHAMGNPASDVPELTGLLQALKSRAGTSEELLPLLGHKSLFGHSASASGVVGITVVSLALSNRQVPAPLISSPMDLILNDGIICQPIGAGVPLRASPDYVFGSISGTAISDDNVHLVLSGHDETRPLVIKVDTKFETCGYAPAAGNGQVIRTPATEEPDAIFPSLIRSKYTTSPPIVDLRAMSEDELQSVPDFKLECTGLGRLEWQIPVDVRYSDLDSIRFMQGGIHFDKTQLPALDCECLVTIKHRSLKAGVAEHNVAKYCAKLQRKVENSGARFVHFDPCSGMLQMQVKHFSKVGFFDACSDDSELSSGEELDFSRSQHDIALNPETSSSQTTNPETEVCLPIAQSTLCEFQNVLSTTMQEHKDAVEPSVVPVPYEAQLVDIQHSVTQTIRQQTNGLPVALDQSLMAAGITSRQSVAIATRLSRQLRVALSPVDLFNHPTIASLAEHLASRLGLRTVAAAYTKDHPLVSSQPLMVNPPAHSFTVASIACASPGGCATLAALFSGLLCSGADPVCLPPPSRADHAALPADTTLLPGHFVQHAELFEPGLFGMSPAEVEATDPNQRLLLQTAFTALVRAGWVKQTLLQAELGVFVGFGQSAWSEVVRGRAPSVFSNHGMLACAASARIAFTLGLRGPCLSTDTACSSSLVALDAARQCLQLGRCEAALGAGVNVHPHWVSWVRSAGLPLAPDGKSKTFDGSADGYGRGEGCFAVLLQTHRGDDRGAHIAVLIGSGVNQDGRSANFAAPSGPAQQLVVGLAMAGTKAGSKHAVETHGTGTKLGDPIEVEALRSVLDDSHSNDALLLGALKTRIGHTEFAAGLAGLTRVVLGLQLDWAAPNLHLSRVNSYLGLDGFEVLLSSQNSHSSADTAGVSSFGFTGTNSHAVVGIPRKGEFVARLAIAIWVQMYNPVAFFWWTTDIRALDEDILVPTSPQLQHRCRNSDSVWDHSHLYGVAWAPSVNSHGQPCELDCVLICCGTETLDFGHTVIQSDTNACYCALLCIADSSPLYGQIQLAVSAPTQTGLWLGSTNWSTSVGFARSVRLERPGLRCDCIESTTTNVVLDLLPHSKSIQGDELSLRCGKPAVARLERLASAQASVGPVHLSSCAISGGTGALGLLVGLWLAGRGREELSLLSRSGRSGSGAHWAQLQNLGTALSLIACDISSCLAGMDAQPTGIVHAAGVDMNSRLSDLVQAQQHTVLAPKTDGARNLQHGLTDAPLQYAVMFSSASALVGLRSGSTYAAANSYLDGFAQAQRAAGLPAQSVQWGAWTEIGMAAGIEASGYMTGGVTNAIGLSAMRAMLAGWLQPGMFVADMVWHQFLRLYSTVPGLLSGFQVADEGSTLDLPTERSSQQATTRAVAKGLDNSLVSALMGLNSPDRLTRLESMVLEAVATVSGLQVELDEPLVEAGLDSLGALELRNQLDRELGGLSLTASMVFEHKTVAALTAHLDMLVLDTADKLDATSLRPLVSVQPAVGMQTAGELVCIHGRCRWYS